MRVPESARGRIRNRRTRVVLDAMGSDRAPEPEVAGALAAVRTHDVDVVLVGDVAQLSAATHERVALVHATEVVTMHDRPAQAYRGKPDSSMRVAVARVAAGGADAVVSAGNSGAMLATCVLSLGRLPGIERPAIATVLPTPHGPVVLCDAGANLDPKPAMLAQFAALGAAYARVVHGLARPRVGVLANGAEPSKGTELTRAALEILARGGAFELVGHVEGSDLFRGAVDVVATDGFTGNIVLKTCEGMAQDMFGRDYHSEIGGALLAGVARPAVIAHGRSDGTAICAAIAAAARFATSGLVAQLAAALV